MGDKYDDLYLAVVKNGSGCDFKIAPNCTHKFAMLGKLEQNTDSIGERKSVFLRSSQPFSAIQNETTAQKSQLPDGAEIPERASGSFKDALAEWLIQTKRIRIVNGEFFASSINGKTYKVGQ